MREVRPRKKMEGLSIGPAYTATATHENGRLYATKSGRRKRLDLAPRLAAKRPRDRIFHPTGTESEEATCEIGIERASQLAWAECSTPLHDDCDTADRMIVPDRWGFLPSRRAGTVLALGAPLKLVVSPF